VRSLSIAIEHSLAISDVAVLRCLLEATDARRHPLEWRRNDNRHVSNLEGLRVELVRQSSFRGSRLCLFLSLNDYATCIEQPKPAYWSGGSKFRTEEERRVSELFEALARAVAVEPLSKKQNRKMLFYTQKTNSV
jgi:hypothetical protein